MRKKHIGFFKAKLSYKFYNNLNGQYGLTKGFQTET